MASKYTVRYRGCDGTQTTRFSTLTNVQEYVKARWQGAEYIDGPTGFHTDYACYALTGCTLADLGYRGDVNSDEDGYWVWHWKDLVNPNAVVNYKNTPVEELCKAGKYVVLAHRLRYHWNTDAIIGEDTFLESIHDTLGGAESAVPEDYYDDMWYETRGPEYYAPKPLPPAFTPSEDDEIPF